MAALSGFCCFELGDAEQLQHTALWSPVQIHQRWVPGPPAGPSLLFSSTFVLLWEPQSGPDQITGSLREVRLPLHNELAGPGVRFLKIVLSSSNNKRTLLSFYTRDEKLQPLVKTKPWPPLLLGRHSAIVWDFFWSRQMSVGGAKETVLFVCLFDLSTPVNL